MRWSSTQTKANNALQMSAFKDLSRKKRNQCLLKYISKCNILRAGAFNFTRIKLSFLCAVYWREKKNPNPFGFNVISRFIPPRHFPSCISAASGNFVKCRVEPFRSRRASTHAMCSSFSGGLIELVAAPACFQIKLKNNFHDDGSQPELNTSV